MKYYKWVHEDAVPSRRLLLEQAFLDIKDSNADDGDDASVIDDSGDSTDEYEEEFANDIIFI